MEREVILVVWPQDPTKKRRPSLILRELNKYGDVLISTITSQVHQQSDLNFLLKSSHPDFKLSGLRVDSVIRLDNVLTVPKSWIKGNMGHISIELHEKLLKDLANYLTANIS